MPQMLIPSRDAADEACSRITKSQSVEHRHSAPLRNPNPATHHRPAPRTAPRRENAKSPETPGPSNQHRPDVHEHGSHKLRCPPHVRRDPPRRQRPPPPRSSAALRSKGLFALKGRLRRYVENRSSPRSSPNTRNREPAPARRQRALSHKLREKTQRHTTGRLRSSSASLRAQPASHRSAPGTRTSQRARRASADIIRCSEVASSGWRTKEQAAAA